MPPKKKSQKGAKKPAPKAQKPSGKQSGTSKRPRRSPEEERKAVVAATNTQLDQAARLLAVEALSATCKDLSGSAAATTSGGVGGMLSTAAQFPADSVHAQTLNRLKMRIIAGSKLCHRTSHTLWGPNHSGKSRILHLLGSSLRSTRRLLVIHLDGNLFENDEDGAIATCIDELRAFVNRRCVPNETKVVLRNMFAKLKLIPKDEADEEEEDEAAPRLQGKAREWNHGEWLDREDELYDFDAADNENSRVGGSGLLAGLQTALLQLNQIMEVSIVICINNIEKLALWCDRLMYVIAGLMQECEEAKGGVSLVMTSTSSSVSVEKRLTSRLSCEMWYLPPRELTLASVLATCLARAVEMLKTPTEQSDVVDLQQHLAVVQPIGDRLKAVHTTPHQIHTAAATYLLSQQAVEVESAGSGEVKLSLNTAEYGHVLRLQNGDVFDHLLGAAPLSAPVPAAALAPFSMFPTRRSDCSRETFLLMLFIYANADKDASRNFLDTFQQICSYSRERSTHPGELLNYQRALHELCKLHVVTVARKGELLLGRDKHETRRFLSKVLESSKLHQACGINLGEQAMLRSLL